MYMKNRPMTGANYSKVNHFSQKCLRRMAPCTYPLQGCAKPHTAPFRSWVTERSCKQSVNCFRYYKYHILQKVQVKDKKCTVAALDKKTNHSTKMEHNETQWPKCALHSQQRGRVQPRDSECTRLVAGFKHRKQGNEPFGKQGLFVPYVSEPRCVASILSFSNTSCSHSFWG